MFRTRATCSLSPGFAGGEGWGEGGSWCLGVKIYAFYTRPAHTATPFLCADSYSARRCTTSFDRHPMDIVYLLFCFVLSAASIGFLLICDRLGKRP